MTFQPYIKLNEHSSFGSSIFRLLHPKIYEMILTDLKGIVIKHLRVEIFLYQYIYGAVQQLFNFYDIHSPLLQSLFVDLRSRIFWLQRVHLPGQTFPEWSGVSWTFRHLHSETQSASAANPQGSDFYPDMK